MLALLSFTLKRKQVFCWTKLVELGELNLFTPAEVYEPSFLPVDTGRYFFFSPDQIDNDVQQRLLA